MVKNIKTISSIGVAGLIGLAALLRSCTIVPAGNVAVQHTFGSVRNVELNPGLSFINPLSSVVKIQTRTQELKESIKVPTKEGLMAGLDVSILYKIDLSKADEIYKTLGVDYTNVVISPNLRNVARDVVANYGSEDLYSVNRAKIASDITSQLMEVYQQRGIILESVLLRDVSLPNEVTAAIDRKISAKQAAEQMQYVLQKEEQESERKRVEAKGIADAQKIIAESLNNEYLTWKYIESINNLANSENTTFVITPYDQKLIPMLPLQESKK
ncbi:MAG: prohibitin family protein [Nanoarchaeota archaeon]|mgnify:CR=1 FL=1